jgi:peptide methionine sulfoxide reductase msrA/msrB
MKIFLLMSLIVTVIFTTNAHAWDAKQFKKPSQEELKKKLSSEQFNVTQKADTERPFHNEYWNNEAEGIYVDVVSGEPLFSSLDKFDSGTGWPSFSRPLVKQNLLEKPDKELGMERTEVRSHYGNSHLGHLFDDGPKPTGLRYCMNSASLRFVAKDKLKEQGYGEYSHLFVTAKPVATAPAAKTETATFAAGCFWGSEEFFRKIPGVMSTRVGFTGGKTEHPKYEETHDGHTGHAESVEVTFDPTKVSYEQLLDGFFKMHDPTTMNRQGNDVGSQYRSAIFYHGEQQKIVAEKFKAKVQKSGAWKSPVVTEIQAAKVFWPAEDYHQKYLVKNPGGYDNHYVRQISFDPPTAKPQ